VAGNDVGGAHCFTAHRKSVNLRTAAVLAGNSDFSARQYKRSLSHVSGCVECVPYFYNVKHAGNPTAESSETNNNPIN
jgi:hypothetical protein